jgi:hypothetical protein
MFEFGLKKYINIHVKNGIRINPYWHPFFNELSNTNTESIRRAGGSKLCVKKPGSHDPSRALHYCYTYTAYTSAERKR